MVYHGLFLVIYSEIMGQNHLEYQISGMYRYLWGHDGLPNTYIYGEIMGFQTHLSTVK